MNKKVKLILQGILFVVIIVGFIYIGTRDFNKEVVVDNERFDADYVNVSKDNVFKYANAVEVYQALKGNAIIFMGYPANVWSGYYANILNEAAKDAGIKEILYYDFYEDRENRNGTYQSIVLSLTNYLVTLDDGTEEGKKAVREAEEQRARIREDGYSITFEEINPNVAAIAVPIFGFNNIIAGSMAIAGPCERFTPEIINRYIPLIKEYGKRLSERLGANTI